MKGEKSMRFQRGVRAALLALVLVSMIIPPQVQAQAACGVGTLNAYGNETITVSSTALGFTAANYDPSTQLVLVTVAVDNIRFWNNGATPTATVGHLVASGTPFYVCGFSNIQRFRMIRQTTDATVSVSYYR